jgi:hypothetical protein
VRNADVPRQVTLPPKLTTASVVRAYQVASIVQRIVAVLVGRVLASSLLPFKYISQTGSLPQPHYTTDGPIMHPLTPVTTWPLQHHDLKHYYQSAPREVVWSPLHNKHSPHHFTRQQDMRHPHIKEYINQTGVDLEMKRFHQLLLLLSSFHCLRCTSMPITCSLATSSSAAPLERRVSHNDTRKDWINDD